MAIVAFATASAQQTSESKNQTVTVTIQSRIDVTLSAATVNLAVGTLDEFANGAHNEATPTTVTVNSNKGFDLTVAPQATNFTPSGTPSIQMPSSVLALRVGAGSYTSFSGVTAQTIADDAVKGSHNYSIAVKATPGYTYDPMSYSLVLVYTATQN